MIGRYTTWGPVRGCCWHAHQTQEAAERCAEQDARWCTGRGAYSDREVREVDSAAEVRSHDRRCGPGRRPEPWDGADEELEALRSEL